MTSSGHTQFPNTSFIWRGDSGAAPDHISAPSLCDHTGLHDSDALFSTISAVRCHLTRFHGVVLYRFITTFVGTLWFFMSLALSNLIKHQCPLSLKMFLFTLYVHILVVDLFYSRTCFKHQRYFIALIIFYMWPCLSKYNIILFAYECGCAL